MSGTAAPWPQRGRGPRSTSYGSRAEAHRAQTRASSPRRRQRTPQRGIQQQTQTRSGVCGKESVLRNARKRLIVCQSSCETTTSLAVIHRPVDPAPSTEPVRARRRKPPGTLSRCSGSERRRWQGVPGWHADAWPLRRGRLSSRAQITTSPVPSWWRIHTVCPNSVAGREYWQCSKVTIGVLSGTRRVTPTRWCWADRAPHARQDVPEKASRSDGGPSCGAPGRWSRPRTPR